MNTVRYARRAPVLMRTLPSYNRFLYNSGERDRWLEAFL